LAEIHFSPDCGLRQINGLHGGNRIEIIEILGSVETTCVFGRLTLSPADVKPKLKGIVLRRENHLRTLDGRSHSDVLEAFRDYDFD
jgi:hypothetical protein